MDVEVAGIIIMEAREDWFKAGEIITEDINEEEPKAETETKETEDSPAEEPEVEIETEPETAKETQTEKIKTEE